MDFFRAMYLRTFLAVSDLKRREEGQALVEYALLLALIAVVSIGILTTLGENVSKIFSQISNKV